MNLLLAGVASVGAIGLLAGVMMLATSPGRDLSAAEPTPGADPVHATSEIWTHDAPAETFTADRAHREMQNHRDCLLNECARKAAAFQTLIEAGRVTPDSGRM
ncbi:hypothetical protein [Nocardia sp. NPDC057353]|uniref:hypothetical protein n=1 Tax=Nocardia sp. NPDC057353 TaxID=3346104 RepID=UPI0036287B61